MLNQILVALLTGATALGIPMGDQENHNQASNAPSMSNVQRAYYDESETYGTTSGQIFNYTGYTLAVDGDSEVTINNSGYGLAKTYEYDGEYRYCINDSEGNYGYVPDFKLDGGNYRNPLDLYINGVLFTTLTAGNNGYYRMPEYDTTTIQMNTLYNAWLFEHQEPKMEEGIFEVVGDTLTAFASTIGVGFTAIIQIFYNNGVTPLGILALIVAGVSLVWFAWNLISGLLRQRR